jgi:hypothetical protein
LSRELVLEETPNAPAPGALNSRFNTSAEASDKDTESSMALRLARQLQISKIFPENVAHLFHSPGEHTMNVAGLSEVAPAYDKVGVYDQDAVNGFSEQMLTTMLDIVNPGYTSNILDAMAGNGNLTSRLYDYCEQRGIISPDVVVLEFSRVQCQFAKERLADTPAKVVWGDILTMEDYEHEELLPNSGVRSHFSD